MPEPLAPKREQLLLLIRGGATPEDAARTLGITDPELTALRDTENFLEEVAAAEAHARTMIDTGERKARPGEWARRSRDPVEVALPGQPHKCGAKNRKGNPCGRSAELGAARCRFHGAASPQSRSVAQRRLAVHTIGAELARLGDQGDADPLTEILAVVHADRAEVLLYSALQRHVPVAEADSHGWVTLYHDALDRLAKHSKMALDAGVDLSMVRIAESTADVFAKMVAAMIDDPEWSLTPEQQAQGRMLAARHLRALPTGTG